MSVPSPEKHRTISPRLSTERETRRVAHWVNFRFNDPPAESASRNIVDYYLANQVPCQRYGVQGKFGSTKTPKPSVRRCLIGLLHPDSVDSRESPLRGGKQENSRGWWSAIHYAATSWATCCTSLIIPVSTSNTKPRTGTSLAIHGCERTFLICSRVFCSGSL